MSGELEENEGQLLGQLLKQPIEHSDRVPASAHYVLKPAQSNTCNWYPILLRKSAKLLTLLAYTTFIISSLIR